MAETSIGIKIADGTFFPVLEEATPGRRRVILTTVKDNQTGAQIDLYRGNGTGIEGATYLGSLVIDDIEPAPKGTPEIELIVGLGEGGKLDAEVSDYITGEHQTLSVSLDSVNATEDYAMPEFDLDERYHPELGVSPAEVTRLTSQPVTPDFSGVEDDVRRQRRRKVLQYLGITILVLVILAIAAALIIWFTRRPAPATTQPAASTASQATSTTQAAPAASTPAQAAPAASTPAQTAPAASTPAQTAPAASTPARAAPAASTAAQTETKPPQQQPAGPSTPAATGKPAYREGGVVYQIRWGDTLWDLSISFYRTPWLYGKIAKANDIKNPNLIFANTQIYIPER